MADQTSQQGGAAAPATTTAPAAEPIATPAAAPTTPPAKEAPAAPPATEPAKAAAEVKQEATPAAPPPAPNKIVEPAKAAAPTEIEIKLPEGVKFDTAAVDNFKALAKEHGITSKQAQALIDAEAKRAVQAEQANAQAQKNALQAMRTKDIETLKADKDFGGAKYEKTVSDARAAAKYWGGEELSKLLETTGLDNHPAIVKTLARIRAGMKEDDTGSRIPGATPPPQNPRAGMTQKQRLALRYETK